MNHTTKYFKNYLPLDIASDKVVVDGLRIKLGTGNLIEGIITKPPCQDAELVEKMKIGVICDFVRIVSHPIYFILFFIHF